MRAYELKNLNCPNCAAKIEARVGELPQVSEAKLDFVSKRLVVEGDVSAEELQQLVDSIEDGVLVVEKMPAKKVRMKKRTAASKKKSSPSQMPLWLPFWCNSSTKGAFKRLYGGFF